MGDPGIAFKCATLLAAWRLLGHKWGQSRISVAKDSQPKFDSDPIYLPEDALDAIEELALGSGMRTRRVILDAGWWKQAATPMIARVADRRRVARAEDEPQYNAAAAAGTGWVTLIPQRTGGYRMLTPFPEEGTVVEWPVNAEVAARLAPFAFTFHPRFAPRALRARDILRFAFSHGGYDLILLVTAGFAAALIGLLTPVATGWMIDRAIPAKATANVAGIVAALGLAGSRSSRSTSCAPTR
jgi:ABC-type bacteriocin/lantibiotic exporter with double-glycine peptidase domain